MEHRELEISKNISGMEYLKSRILTALAVLFQSLLKGNESMAEKTLARIILCCYLIGRRMGVQPARIDLRLEQEITADIKRGNQLERNFGDLTYMNNYIKRSKGL